MQVFSSEWFDHHQSRLLWLLQAPLLGRVMRRVLAIRPHDVGWDRPIVELLPHAYTVANPDDTFTMDCRTHAKYGKRLYYQLLPLWTLLHAWDMVVANPLVPVLNAGFDTLTVYPDPYGGSVSSDGRVGRSIVGSPESWLTIIAGAGNSAITNEGNSYIFYAEWNGSGSDLYQNYFRGVWQFDTTLPGNAVVDGAALSLYGWGKTDAVFTGSPNSPVSNIYGCTPNSATTLIASDYGACGSTPLSSDLAYSSVSTSAYNMFTLNTSGLAFISRTGVTAFSGRCDYDVLAVTPNPGYFNVGVWYADQTGSANDPKLEVTYSLSESLQPKNALRPRVFAPGRAR